MPRAKKTPAAPDVPKRPTALDMKAAAQKLPYSARSADIRLQSASELTSYRAAGKLGAKLRSSPAPIPASGGPWPLPRKKLFAG